MRLIWQLMLIAGTAYAAVCLLLFFFQSRLIYFPDRALAATPRAVGLSFDDVTVETSDGLRLHGWFVPSPQRDSPVLLFFHGNAGNISHRLESLLVFHRLGLGVLIVDYRGYGRSEGAPSEAGTYRDAEAAWRYLTEERNIGPERVVLFGRSLGAAVAAWLASQVNSGALIVESAFTSVPDLAAKVYPLFPVRLLARFRYATETTVRQVDCPVLIIHSRDDEIVPFGHGRAIFDASREPKSFLRIRGGHNDGFLVSGDDYLGGIRAFLNSVFGR